MKEDPSAIHVAPWMHVIPRGGGVPLDELLPATGGVYVARFNGQDMPDEMAVFQHFAEALKFPEYFGWNWNAFHDCVRDLEWLSADHHVLIIDSAESVLSEDDDARKEFFGSLWRAGRRWSYVKRPEGVTLTKLTVVWSCDQESVSDLVKQLEEFQDA
ncbi:barstar family protein [Streptomyces sp. NPDC055796]